jgi:hypothetical protein
VAHEPVDGRDGNVHAVAVAALVKLLARLELLKSRIGQQGIPFGSPPGPRRRFWWITPAGNLFYALLLILQTKWRPMPINFIQQARSIAIKLGSIMVKVSPKRLNPTFAKT